MSLNSGTRTTRKLCSEILKFFPLQIFSFSRIFTHYVISGPNLNSHIRSYRNLIKCNVACIQSSFSLRSVTTHHTDLLVQKLSQWTEMYCHKISHLFLLTAVWIVGWGEMKPAKKANAGVWLPQRKQNKIYSPLLSLCLRVAFLLAECLWLLFLNSIIAWVHI